MKPSMPVNANAGVAVKPTKVTFQRVVHSPTVSIHNPTIMENFIAVPASSVNTDGIQQSKATSASPKHFKLANRAPGHVTVSTLSHSQALHTPDGAHSGDNAGAGSLANTKEKTPMCLINELARFNRVTHQYTLVDEQGPAHKKNFFVKLQVDKEEYSASGPSIKKAQHAAAAIALEKTAFKHPPPKPLRKPGQDFSEVLGDGSSLTPTVELNAVAMKRGEPAIYRNIENRQNMFYPHNYDFRGMYNQRYHVMRPPRIYYVSLKVGSREFIGEGISRQAARHNAAKKALEILRSLQLPEGRSEKVVSSCGDEDEATDKKEAGDENEDSKSEISLVHEIALRNNLPVAFDVIRETGPPHMKNFVTLCTVGMFKTEADGNSKKLSKKRAAELMLKELKNLPVVISPIPRPKTKPLPN
ncbi:hypothetical protein DPMN_072085 [Dreissena polymorpha]|uniref:DRBM domain-containing protein n=1 Tax=Dreissena polymorpha TaxID=45954 RepID=A0A9D4BW84_DREPO|nr:hypothetical protein DPMN_072085 [Dreissena polymorpha]